MKNILQIIICIAIFNIQYSISNAQTIGRKVVSTAGGTLTGGSNMITFTIGETVIPTLNAGGKIITQGFQQPGEEICTGIVATTVCAGSNISVPYTAIDIGGGNTFTAQLSNASGSFAAPADIGTSTGNASAGSISATIPFNTPAGTGYRIRVKASVPLINGKDNGSNIIIGAGLTASATSSNPLIFYGYTLDQKSPITVTTSGGTGSKTYAWSMSRGLLCNMVNSAGDELLLDGWAASCSGNTVANSTSLAGIYTGTSFSAILTTDANFNVVVTDANGCSATSSVHIDAIDARCFAGNSSIVKIQMCHHTASASNPYITICVAQSAVAELLALGDCIGPCSAYADPLNCTGYRYGDVNNSTRFGIALYPNPASTSATLQFEGYAEGNAQLAIYDLVGKQLLDQNLKVVSGNNEYKLDFETWPKGVYTVKVVYNGVTRNSKLAVVQ